MATVLKPCPFCGDKFPTLHISTDKRYLVNIYGEGILVEDNSYEIACRICGCRTSLWTNKEKAIEAWNRRVADER